MTVGKSLGHTQASTTLRYASLFDTVQKASLFDTVQKEGITRATELMRAGDR
jgi:hypothetical protein